MKRKLLVAAAATAPLLAAHGAWAQLTISTSTNTPVATGTAVSGGPADINITSSGTIGLLNPGTAVTVNSSNNVSNAGSIGATDLDNVVGIKVLGGVTSTVTNTGTISLYETYSPSDSNNDGLIDGNFASGGNRYGIVYAGGAPVTGALVDTGTISIRGNASYGIQMFGPITGDLAMYQVTPATSTTTATIAAGSITILGNNSVGLYVAPSGGVGGNVLITSINATGTGAQAAVVDGPVGGKVDISSTVYATGFRSTSRSQIPALAALYTPQEITQGGPAVVVGGSVANGVIVSAPPLVLSTTNLDQDNNGVPDSIQGTGTVTSYGSAPALQIGDTNLTAVVGPSTAAATYGGGYGVVIQGTVTGNGLFDQISSPNISGPIPATAIQIGAPGATVHVVGGLFNSGTIQAQAYQANATGIHILGGATVDSILNNGAITSNAELEAPFSAGVTPLSVYGLLIEPGANVPNITNTSGITANITGTSVSGSTTGILPQTVGAIIDRSGSVQTITNTGTIAAELTQTQLSTPLVGNLTAIDVSAGTLPQTLTQSISTTYAGAAAYDATISYTVGQIVVENGVVYQATTATGVAVDPATNPSLWRQIGANTPSINGSIYFGNGGTTINVLGGSIIGPTISLGTGVNTITVNGTGALLTGGLVEGGNGTLTLNVLNGTLSNTNPAQIVARSVNVGANGVLLAAVNPATPGTANIVVTGSGANSSNFANGSQVGITLAATQQAQSETYIVVQAAPGATLNVGTFGSGSSSIAPYLYNATTNYVPSLAEITVTATLKSQSQLGFTNAEYAALPAVLQALPQNSTIQNAILAQTSLSGLRGVYDQLLPAQGQGLFDALDKAVQSVSALTSANPDAGTRVAGSSLWLQEVNERVRRTGLESQGSFSKLFGVVGGYERSGERGGAVGLTLAYYNDEETESAQATGGGVVASLIEASAYYRRAVGGLTLAARGGGGVGFFNETRRFVEPSAEASATSSWNGYFMEGHFGVAYEHRLIGRYYARPELSADFLRLYETAHNENSSSPGFALQLASRTSDRFSGQAVFVLGAQFGKASWLRTEVRGGYREVFAGAVGNTDANFTGGSVFSLAPDEEKGGWATVGLSIKGGSQFSYVALEGDADFRHGERRYDVRIAGRSIF